MPVLLFSSRVPVVLLSVVRVMCGCAGYARLCGAMRVMRARFRRRYVIDFVVGVYVGGVLVVTGAIMSPVLLRNVRFYIGT